MTKFHSKYKVLNDSLGNFGDNVPLTGSGAGSSKEHYQLTHVILDDSPPKNREAPFTYEEKVIYTRKKMAQPSPVFRVVPLPTASRDATEQLTEIPPIDGDPTLSETFEEEDGNWDNQSVALQTVMSECQNLKDQNAKLAKQLTKAQDTIRLLALQMNQLQGIAHNTVQRLQKQVPFQVSSSPNEALQVPGLTMASFDTTDTASTGLSSWVRSQGEADQQFQVIRKQESWGTPSATWPGTSSADSVSTLSRTGTFDTADMSLGPEQQSHLSAPTPARQQPAHISPRSAKSLGSNKTLPIVSQVPIVSRVPEDLNQKPPRPCRTMNVTDKKKRSKSKAKKNEHDHKEPKKDKSVFKSIFSQKKASDSHCNSIRDDNTEVAGNTIVQNLSRSFSNSFDHSDTLAEF